jgi:multidrug efflux pump subunit AcrA (membrane-fusion protein)
VATVERAEASSRAFTGVVVARTQSDLGFRVSGKLERLVETGQSVKRGQLLLRLDPADLTLQAQSQQRAVDAAARAKKATNDLARYRGLVASGAVSAANSTRLTQRQRRREPTSARPRRRPTWRKTPPAMPDCWRTLTAWWWKRSPSRGRWSAPDRW